MNKELFNSMQKQMTPSPEVRAALSEKLARPAKKRPVPWMKYGAVAACAVLAVGAVSVYGLRRNPQAWMMITKNFHHDAQVQNLHSYVLVEGLSGSVTENAAVAENTMTGGGETGALPNLGDVLPGGAYVGDVPSQEDAIAAYDKLVPHVASHPDWYGGAYIDNSGTLVVCLVESEDPGDKSLELQVLDWTDNGRVAFSSCKYSLRYLRDLQEKVVDAMNERGLFAGCGADEEYNRLDLTLTSVTDEALALLARLDPDDDAIYVQVGQFTTADDLASEDPAVHHAMPGGITPPVPEDDADLIADEPWVDDMDGAHYDVEELPQSKQPAVAQSVPEEDVSPNPERPVHGDSSAMTAAYDPDVGFIYPTQ